MSTIEEPGAERCPGEPAEACMLARAQLSHDLAGDLARSDQRRLRAHLARCAPCRARFEEAIAFTARLHSGARRSDAEAARQDRRQAQRARALAGAMKLPGGARGVRLRLILLPALAIFLFTQLAQGPRAAEDVRVEPLEGLVQLGEREVLAPQAPIAIGSGELCATGSVGRARISVSGATIELAPESWVWLESGRPARLRLGGGRALVRGRATLTSRLGVVEITGAARVRLDARELEVEALQGDVLLADSRGQRSVPSGTALALRAP